jgi:hypothetical protein
MPLFCRAAIILPLALLLLGPEVTTSAARGHWSLQRGFSLYEGISYVLHEGTLSITMANMLISAYTKNSREKPILSTKSLMKIEQVECTK